MRKGEEKKQQDTNITSCPFCANSVGELKQSVSLNLCGRMQKRRRRDQRSPVTIYSGRLSTVMACFLCMGSHSVQVNWIGGGEKEEQVQ